MNATQSPVVTVRVSDRHTDASNCTVFTGARDIVLVVWPVLASVGQCAGGLASDTLPLLQPCCQSVSRQSGGARQYILCSPNTLNTEYISAPNTP